MKKITFLIFFLASPLWAGPGETGLTFLTFGNGARATGMGEAQVALAQGASAIYWNPAGLGIEPFHEVSLTYLQHFEDSTHQHGSFAMPLNRGRWGGLGFAITRFAVEDIIARDADTNRIGTVEQQDLNLQLSYGFRVLGASTGSGKEGLFFGLGVKRVSQELAGIKASGLAYDVGTHYRPGNKMTDRFGEWVRRTSLGISSLHLGRGPKFDRDETPLPQTTKIGLGYTHFLWGDALNFALDFNMPNKEDTFLAVGTEYWYRNRVAARVGYKDAQDIGEGLRAGAGFRFQALQVDYAWAGFADEFGDTHRFTVSFTFGEGAVGVKEGLKKDLVSFHLSNAQDALTEKVYHEAILEANRVLEVDPKNARALQILIEAGEKMKPVDSLPKAEDSTDANSK